MRRRWPWLAGLILVLALVLGVLFAAGRPEYEFLRNAKFVGEDAAPPDNVIRLYIVHTDCYEMYRKMKTELARLGINQSGGSSDPRFSVWQFGGAESIVLVSPRLARMMTVKFKVPELDESWAVVGIMGHKLSLWDKVRRMLRLK